MCFFNISHFSSTNCLEVMSERTQEDAGEERVTAKSKMEMEMDSHGGLEVKTRQTESKKNYPTTSWHRMMNLVSRCSVRNPNVLAFTASGSPEKTRYESQIPLSSWTEQQPRTERPAMDACSSNCSEWKIECDRGRTNPQ